MTSCFRIAFCILASMMCSNSLYDIDFNIADKNYVELTFDRSFSMSETSNLFNDKLFRRSLWECQNNSSVIILASGEKQAK